MFAGLGAALVLLATYGFLAWRLSMGLIETLLFLGLALLAAQFFHFQRDPETEPAVLAEPVLSESKGDADGCR
jgi:hypothetical protein